MFDQNSQSSYGILAPKAIFSILREFDTSLSLVDCTMNKSRSLFARVLIDIDMLSALPNQILVERLGFAFIPNIEFDKLSPFCSSCKMIGYDF